MDPDFGIFPQYRQVFGEIKLRPQFSDRQLPLPDLIECRRREQPLRQCFLTHASARRRQQFEQTAPAEQIEVGGINMVRIVEALSGLSRARPLVSHPGQSLAIVGGSTLRQVESPQDLRMISRDRNEEQRGREQPGEREHLPAERHPGHGCGHNHQRQTKVSESNVNFLLPRGAGLARFETLLVFLAGRHSLEDISAPRSCRAGALARRLALRSPIHLAVSFFNS